MGLDKLACGIHNTALKDCCPVFFPLRDCSVFVALKTVYFITMKNSCPLGNVFINYFKYFCSFIVVVVAIYGSHKI